MKNFRVVVIVLLIATGLFGIYSATGRKSGLNKEEAPIAALNGNQLVATNYIYHASELLHSKRLLVEKLEQVNSVMIAEENQNLTPKLKEVLEQYRATGLTAEEHAILSSLLDHTSEIEAIESELLYSYQVRDRLRFLSSEALAKLRTLADMQLKEGAVATSAGQTANEASGVVTDNLVTAIFVIGLIGLIFFFSRVTRKTGGLGRPYVRYLNSLMM